MITLAPTETLQASASANTAINYSLEGDTIATAIDAFGGQGEGQLSTSIAAMATAGAAQQILLSSIFFTNITASPVTINIYKNGTSSTKKKWTLVIPAGGSGGYEDKRGWYIVDSSSSPTTSYNLSNATPQALGVAASGVSTQASRDDHVHAMPRLDQVSVPTTTVSMGSQVLANLAPGVAGTDAVNLTQLTNAVTGLADYRGSYDASTNLFPSTGGSGVAGAILKADYWIVSVAGTLGTVSVKIGDLVTALVDTPAQVAASWDLISHDIGYVPEDQANKSNAALGTSTTLYPTQGAVKTYADGKVENSIVSGHTTVAPSGDAVFTALAAKANDSAVVHNTGNETIGGTKTFSSAPTVPANSFPESAVNGLTTDLAGKQPTGNYVTALTGDVTASGPGSVAATLATVNSNVGTFGDSQHVAHVTVNGKGLITAVSNVAVVSPTGWIDVTLAATPVLTGNAAATNDANLASILSAAADGSLIYFPPSTSVYQFSASQATLTKDFYFYGVRGQSQIAFVANMAGSWLTFANTGFYVSVSGLSFINFVTQTAGAVLTCQNNVNVLVEDCFFTGSAAATLNNVIDFTGTNSGNGAVLRNLYMNGWSGNGITIASPLDTIYMQDLELLGTAGGTQVAATGISCTNGGAILMSDCQIIRCNINVDLFPTNTLTVSAVYATNCFFDQGVTNCMRLTGSGTGTIARCHFVGSWFTVSANGTNPVCILISSSGTGIHAGIEFQNSWIMNATPGSTGTLTGISATAVQDITINNSQMAGWTIDISLTPASAGTCSPIIQGNTMSAAGLIAASTTNIVLNAGSFAFGDILIQNNSLGGTTKLTDNSTVSGTFRKLINNNTGLVSPGMYAGTINGAAQANTASADNVLTGTLFQIPTNGLRVGSKFRFDVQVAKTAAGAAVWSAKVKFGTAGSNADAAIATFTSGTNTAAIDNAVLSIFVEVTALGATATVKAFANYMNQLTTATGLGSMPIAPTSTATFNSTLTTPFLHVDLTPGASAVMTAAGSAQVIT